MTNPPSVPSLDVETCARCGRPEVEHYSRARVCPTYSMFRPSLGADGVPSHRESPQSACGVSIAAQSDVPSADERVAASSPALDVEACVRLLGIAADRHERHARRLEKSGYIGEGPDGERSNASQLRALASALAGMGNDSERYRFLRDNPLQLRAIDGNANAYRTNPTAFDELVDAARAAQPEETKP